MALTEKPNAEIFNYSSTIALNLTKLKINEYYVIFENERDEVLELIPVINECYNCPVYSSIPYFIQTEPNYRVFNAKYSERWWIKSSRNGFIDNFEPDVGEFGVYKLNINEKCTMSTLVSPVNIYLPIIAVILTFLAASAVVVGGTYFYNKKLKKKQNQTAEPEKKRKRIQSLDVFRGLSIILMILVNYGGGGYTFLEHAIWNGLTFADLVFPWFLWIMGVCIPISIKSALKRGDKHIFKHIIRRSIILFLLGLFLNSFTLNIYDMRIFGVLQRFGLCYFIVAGLCLAFMKKELPEKPGKFQDIISMFPQWIFAFLFLIIHLSLTFGLSYDNCPLGYLGPGGLQEDGKMNNFDLYRNCTGGAAGHIDRKILGKHVYRWGMFKLIYLTNLSVDPEGILGTFTAVFQVFLGVQAGMILLVYTGHISRMVRWLIWGTVAGIIGGSLCGFSKEDGIIPVNKILWSLSFVLVTTSFAFILLAMFYAVIDWKTWWTGKPFLFAGMNPIILYMGHQLSYKKFPFDWGVLETSLHFQLLSRAVWCTFCWWIIAYLLYRKKIFLSI